jgi:serpin B
MVKLGTWLIAIWFIAGTLGATGTADMQDADLRELVLGNNEFAFDLYQALRGENTNLFYSPYSISVCLAMTYAGARGETEEEMANILHFALPQDRLHPAFHSLNIELASREGLQLNIANSIWGQADHRFLSEFLSILAENYGAGLKEIDFRGVPEGSRRIINQWVSEETQGKIKNLIPPGGITPLTRFVLTNAIYFKAAWFYPFEETLTHDDTFHLLGGNQVLVPMMSQTEWFRYATGDGCQVVELPYVDGEASMVILLPDLHRFEECERSLGARQVAAILNQIERKCVRLTMPKFTYESSFRLGGTLSGMGMKTTFSPAADFSGMDGTRELFIDEVFHKGYVAVDEAGTEAAAATAIVMELGIPPEAIEVRVDHPFIFLIRDIKTDAILFVGRVLDPS